MRPLRRIALVAFVCWAALAAAALRFEALERNPENHLRLAVAVIGTGMALFAVLRAGAWPRLLYLLAAGYFGYFTAASAWRSFWRVASVPADGGTETLALTLELAFRVVAKQLAAGNTAMAAALAHDLVVMPVVQLVIALYLARRLLAQP